MLIPCMDSFAGVGACYLSCKYQRQLCAVVRSLKSLRSDWDDTFYVTGQPRAAVPTRSVSHKKSQKRTEEKLIELGLTHNLQTCGDLTDRLPARNVLLAELAV